MWLSKLFLGSFLIYLALGRKPFGLELSDPKTVTVGPATATATATTTTTTTATATATAIAAIVGKSSLGCDPPPLRGLLWGPLEGENIYIIIFCFIYYNIIIL